MDTPGRQTKATPARQVAAATAAVTMGDQEQARDKLTEPLVRSDEGKVPHVEQNELHGYLWTLATAALMLSTSILTGFVSSSGTIPTYTQNFVRCFAAATSLLVLARIKGESLLPSGHIAKTCLSFGVADWFFLWGYVKSLIFVSVLQWTVFSTSFGPVVSSVMSFVILGERLSRYKWCALARNMVLAFLIVNPFSDGGSVGKLVTGFCWSLVAACGTAVMRIIQRSNDEVPSIVLMFWGFVVNTLLWLPPGCLPPKLRVPVLWPALPADATDLWELPALSWSIMALSGILGAGIMITQGQALKHLNVGTFSMTVTPLGLVLTVLYSTLHQSLGLLVWLGVTLQALATAADIYQEKRAAA